MSQARKSLAERFNEYHESHPEIFRLFRAYALEMVMAGRKHGGAKAIMEVLRFHSAVDARETGERYKICNNYTAFYARKLMQEEPERFGNFFTLRQQRSAVQSATHGTDQQEAA